MVVGRPAKSRAGATADHRTGVTDELNNEIMRFVRLLKASAGRLRAPDRSASLLLWPLLHEGPMRLRDLADAKGADQSTVSRQVAELVRSGLVRREIDPVDRRACRIALTEHGRDACRLMIEGRRRAVAEALGHWTDEQVTAFSEQFRLFNEAVEAQQERERRVTQ